MLGFVAAGFPVLRRSRILQQFACPLRQVHRMSVSKIKACADTTTEEVRRVANLAQLDLSEDEITKMTPEFQKVISFFDIIKEFDVDGIEPMSTPNDARNIMRDDTPVMFTNVDSIMSEAPSVERDYIRVPKISSEGTE